MGEIQFPMKPPYVFFVFVMSETLKCYEVAGIFLGNWEQSGAEMCMDIQIISTFEAQLHNSVHNYSHGDVETFSMGIFQSRE